MNVVRGEPFNSPESSFGFLIDGFASRASTAYSLD